MWVARLPISIGPIRAVRKTRASTAAAQAATRSLTSIRNQSERPDLRFPESASPTMAVVGLTGTRSS